MSQCEKCGQEMFGAIECFKCGHRIDVEKIKAERAAHEAAEEARRREGFWHQFWFRLKFRGLRSRFADGKGSLNNLEHIGTAKIAVGNIQFRDERLRTTVAATGPEAWSAIEEAPDLVRIAFTCGRCGFVHVLRDTPIPGYFKGGVPGLPIGRFHDSYMGIWQSSWFMLVRPIIARALGEHDTLVCQSCNAKGPPQTRMY